MAGQSIPLEGATFREDNGRFLMSTNDGSQHELRDKAAYDAAVALQSYGGAELAPDFFKN
ncbi:hypothetical protein GCM10023168_32070 [Fodinibacter luteus]|uniref:Uncharacterized protein n=1 Tax=Fodinibacter luteus TaxID=552064 RepID=A0ABP8KNN7_9MICO